MHGCSYRGGNIQKVECTDSKSECTDAHTEGETYKKLSARNTSVYVKTLWFSHRVKLNLSARLRFECTDFGFECTDLRFECTDFGFECTLDFECTVFGFGCTVFDFGAI